jgi:hypothetical protein
MENTSDDNVLKQRKPQLSKSVESLQSLMSPNNPNLTDLNGLIFDKNEAKKLIDKHQQTNSASNHSLTIENICWFVLSIISIYVSDIFRVIIYDPRINRWNLHFFNYF